MLLSIFVNLSFLVYITISFSYDCTDTSTLCKNTNIECSSNEDCFISCGGDKSCQNSLIKCPINGNCNLECLGYKSCQNLIINATLSITGNINILCQDATQECESLSIYGSIYDHTSNKQQTNDLSLKCNGDILSCHKSNIHCPASGDCLVQCSSDESCKNNTITGPNNGDLMVQCTGKSSCIQANIDGKNSDELELNGCSQSNSCLDLTIHCPPMTNISNPNCFIQGNDNLGSYSGQGINIYAENGWQDVEITYSGSYGIRHQGTMHCGIAYDSQCSFASSQWLCADINAYCNNVWTPDTTPSPNDDPTIPMIDTRDGETDGILYDNYTTYPPRPKIDYDSDHNTMGMLLVGGGLIALAFGCVICGAIRKQLDKAERKLSDMGFKSPFKSPYSGPRPPAFGADFGADIANHIHDGGKHKHAHSHHNKKKGGHGHGHGNKHGHGHKHKHGKNINMEPQRIEADSSYSAHGHHNSGYYASHGIHRPNTAPHGLETYTANIHRPNSTSHNKYTINHNGTRTAEINRPHSHHGGVHDNNNNNYNDYGQHHLAQLGVHGHSGHNNKGFKGGKSNGHHGHSHGHKHHNKRSKSHNTEMAHIR